MTDAINDSNSKIVGTSPGKILSAKRNKKKLGEREVADALKISLSRLRSIEADDLNVFPSETYIRGHLKNYSRFIECNDTEVLEAYDQMKPLLLMSEPVSAKVGIPEEGSHNLQTKRIMLLLGAFILLVLIWSVFYWLFVDNSTLATIEPESSLSSSITNSSAESAVSEDDVLSDDTSEGGLDSDSTIVDTATPIKESMADLSGVDGPTNVPLNEGALLEPEAQTPIVVSKLTASELVKSIKANEESKEPVSNPKPEGDSLNFEFSAASWIQVIDDDKKVLFKGLNKPGAKLVLSGKAPFSLIIGNVGATNLLYKGEPVVLTAPSGKNTLRFTLGD